MDDSYTPSVRMLFEDETSSAKKNILTKKSEVKIVIMEYNSFITIIKS